MPNRTFFLDSDSGPACRSRSRPIRSTQEDVTPSSRQSQADRSSSEPDISHRRYARSLAKAEKQRLRRRRLFRDQTSSSTQSEDLENLFEPPSNVEIAPDTSRAASDLAECLKQFPLTESTSLTPLERFLVVNPGEEPFSVDSTKRSTATRIRDGEEICASLRVRSAIQLAAEVMTLRRQVALQGMRCVEESQAVEENERSWLDMEEHSQVSCSGGSRKTVRRAEPDSGRELSPPLA